MRNKNPYSNVRLCQQALLVVSTRLSDIFATVLCDNRHPWGHNKRYSFCFCHECHNGFSTFVTPRSTIKTLNISSYRKRRRGYIFAVVKAVFLYTMCNIAKCIKLAFSPEQSTETYFLPSDCVIFSMYFSSVSLCDFRSNTPVLYLVSIRLFRFRLRKGHSRKVLRKHEIQNLP